MIILTNPKASNGGATLDGQARQTDRQAREGADRRTSRHPPPAGTGGANIGNQVPPYICSHRDF